MSCELALKHFSHPHLLQLSDYQKSKKNQLPSCSACELVPKDWICTCKSCNYLIHLQCSQIPMQIHLPFHRDHSLSLLSIPPYQSGFFTCKACSRQGNGFCYSCTACKVDIHILCATMPQLVTHKSHEHPLDLLLASAYWSGGFKCNICLLTSYDQWLYHCEPCQFDAHLGCAIPEPTIVGSSSATITGKASKNQESSNSTPIKEENVYPDGISSDQKNDDDEEDEEEEDDDEDDDDNDDDDGDDDDDDDDDDNDDDDDEDDIDNDNDNHKDDNEDDD